MAARFAIPGEPHAGVAVYADYGAPVHDRCDVVVVGSGPGGAVAAQVLAARGADVVLLEEGPPKLPRDFTPDAGQTMLGMLREGGMRATRGNVFMPTMQACVLGGGSVINSAISVRAPDFVWDKWAEAHGTGELTAAELAPHYQRVEDFLGIAPTPEAVLGERNLLFRRGCEALGYASEPTPRNAPGCRGSGECFTGCRNGGKTSTDLTYVPAAIRDGARVYTSTRVDRVLSRGRRATGVAGRIIDPESRRETLSFQIDAKAVVLGAGCMATPLILQRSELGNESGRAGRHLRAHPGIAVLAIFPHEVAPQRGATQGYHSLQFVREGFKLEVLWAPPAVIATRFSGFGGEFMDQLQLFQRSAPFDAIIDGYDSEGSVRARPFGHDPDIKYHLGEKDVQKLHRALCVLAEISLAAGAERVFLGLHGYEPELSDKRELDRLRRHRMKATDGVVAGNHVFGTTRMGSDAATSVVDAGGRCHHSDNLYIVDSGIVPASTAVNPMLTIMALADRIAQRLSW